MDSCSAGRAAEGARIDKRGIVGALEEIASLLEVGEANPFQIQAYRSGAQNLDDWDGDLTAAIRDGTLGDIPGVGKGLAAAIAELAERDTCEARERLRSEYPDGLLDLLRVPGLGPKRVRAIWRTLGVSDLVQLEQAAREGRLRTLAGFGEQTERRLLARLERRKG